MGTNEEVIGNLQNLFETSDSVKSPLVPVADCQVDLVVIDDTNADVLAGMKHNPDGQLERLRVAREQSIRCN